MNRYPYVKRIAIVKRRGPQARSFKTISDRRRHRSRSLFAVVLLSSLVMINGLSLPASADHPGYLPSYVGQYVAVATAGQVECWIAEGLTGWLYWNPVPCPDQPEDEVEDVRSANGIESGTLHVLSRIERFESGQLATGADTGSLYYGSAYALPPGRMGNRSYLYAYEAGAWSICDTSRSWSFNTTTTAEFAPTFHWGQACGFNKTYGAWGVGYQKLSVGWRENWQWSGTLTFPCVLCRPGPPSPLPPEPPPHPVLSPVAGMR